MASSLPPAFGIVIQARTGSTRLPNKMTRPFYKNKCLLEVIIDGLLSRYKKNEIYLATSSSPADDVLVKIAKDSGISIFRGSENDVLERFVGCAEKNNLATCVRICADNPFIQPEYIQLLTNDYISSPCDYLSFAFPDGTPIIRSHIGFFAEIVSTAALKKAMIETAEPFYHEHVTNFIYGNPDRYEIRLLPLPEHLKKRTDIRLTIDTAEDFEMVSELYAELGKKNSLYDTATIVAAIDTRPQFRERMLELIGRFSK